MPDGTVQTVAGMVTRGHQDGVKDHVQYGTLLSAAALNMGDAGKSSAGSCGGGEAANSITAGDADADANASLHQGRDSMWAVVADNSSGAVRAVDIHSGRTVTIAGGKRDADFFREKEEHGTMSPNHNSCRSTWRVR